MKQPMANLETLLEEGTHYIDIDGNDGGMMRTAIACGKSEQAAWKAAKRRLEKMLRYVEKQINC